jgi:hypothetical protein
VDLMIEVDNRTPFATQLLTLPDAEGQEISVLVVNATFGLDPSGELAPLDPQPDVCLADEHHGDPASSSVRREAETALPKPRVDVIVIGSAHAPRGRRVRSLVVELRVGEIRKRLRIRGDRGRFLGRIGVSRRFARMPIVFERAYGGTDTRREDPKKHKSFAWNPVGVGYRGAESLNPEISTRLPNIEAVGWGASRKRPAGFGVIGRSWRPRRDLAGTYDARWLDEQFPLPPKDFDPRHHQAAPADQQSNRIRGGEDVVLRNLTPDGVWRFRLPALDVPVHLLFEDRHESASARLDTIYIDADSRQVSLVQRLALPTIRNQPPLRRIVVGHVTNGWLRARVRKKPYRDPADTSGRPRHRPVFL